MSIINSMQCITSCTNEEKDEYQLTLQFPSALQSVMIAAQYFTSPP